ncbi:MAG TPA: zf-HC2 domain-containing protein [Kofleriaceae bacterium]|nr:zf-HC2 domain-containing protein [Kofleriaceae bacterium]
MLQCRDIDSLMMDRLYQELDAVTSAPFDAHVDGCARCRAELDSLAHTREAMQALPAHEPPSSITAILMHEAAKRAPAPARAAAAPLDDRQGGRGFFGWLASLLDPIVAHPAATALATLVLVAGVAGSMYLRGEHRIATPEVASHAEAPSAAEPILQDPPAATPAPEPTVRMPDSNADTAALLEQGYAADLAPEMMEPVDPAKTKAGKGKLERSRQVSKEQAGPGGDSLSANAVSGADRLIDTEADGDVFELQVGGELRNAPRAVPPPPPAPARRVENGSSIGTQSTKKSPQKPSVSRPPVVTVPADKSGAASRDDRAEKNEQAAAAERAWAQTQANKLEDAARLKRCNDAAQIANDILDRNPDYYYAKVTGSVSVKSCSGFVTAERKRRDRVTRSNKAKPKSPAPASGSKDAKAAPQPDEAASE